MFPLSLSLSRRGESDAYDASLLAHAYTVVVDASGAADKAYFYHTAADYKLGLFSSLYERSASGGAPVANLRSNVLTWAQTGNGNPYISATVETIDPGVSGVEKASKVEQAIDNHGNMTERKQYGYYTPGGTPTLLRTFTYTYLATSDYSSRHIWNRVLTAAVQKPGGSSIPLVTNTYDWYPTGISGISGWQQHDDNIYTQYMIYRGNVTRSVSPGKAVNMTYNMGGAVLTTSDDYGHSVTQTPDSGKNYAVPSSITTGSLSTSFSWNGYMAMTGSTAPNSASSSFSYDSYARPSSTTAANGRVTTYTYNTSPNYTVATTGTRWTKTTVDGFGRPMKVESGYNTGSTPTTVAIVDTLNAPCACTPVGKLWKTSLPYAPGGTVYWTETLYL